MTALDGDICQDFFASSKTLEYRCNIEILFSATLLSLPTATLARRIHGTVESGTATIV